MKHTLKISILLLAMFFLAQMIGILVASVYHINIIPFGLSPPEEVRPEYNLFSIILAIIFGVALILILIKVKAEWFLRIWFFLISSLAIGLSLYAISIYFSFSPYYLSWIVLSLGFILAYFKVFVRDIRVHNFTELLIYPGVAALFIPLLNLWTTIVLLVIISLYDIYAVWHAGFMQKMAKYQMQTVKVFAGFLVPYLGKKERELLKKSKGKTKNIKVSVAILGGGDVVFPIILSGIVLFTLGLIPAILVSLGATFALALLFFYSQKGKFYPAMPFITIGCLISLLISLALNL